MTTEEQVMSEVRSLVLERVLREMTPKPPVLTVVGTQRYEDIDRVRDFIMAVARKHPEASLVVGDSSTVEKEAAQAAEDMEMPVTVIPKAPVGSWDEGAAIRDERVVGKATQVVLFDDSARSKDYERLARRMLKPVHRL